MKNSAKKNKVFLLSSICISQVLNEANQGMIRFQLFIAYVVGFIMLDCRNYTAREMYG